MKTRFNHGLSIFLTLGALSLLGRAAGAPASAWAAEPPAITRVGMVNLNKIFKEYEGTKSREEGLEKLSSAKQQEREKMVDGIRQMKDELALLNDEARAQKRESIEEQLRKLAAFDQDARESIRGKRDEALQSTLDEIEQVVTAYAKENNFQLVLSDRAVLYGVQTMDVTDPVIAILNQRYKGKKGGAS